MHYDKHDPTAYSNAMGRYRTRNQLRFIGQHLHGESLRILDIGGGNGRLAVPLADRGHQLTVVDESELAVRLLSEENHPRIRCVHSDITTYRTDNPFDMALAVDCVKHMTRATRAELFAHFNTLLAPKGMFILVEINTGSWRYGVTRMLKRACAYNIDTYRGYVTALGRAGFEIAGARGSRWMPFTFNSNSPFVGVFSRIEDALKLDRWVSQSPWVLIAARKGGNSGVRLAY